jgi:hypothetical protein
MHATCPGHHIFLDFITVINYSYTQQGLRIVDYRLVVVMG